MYCRNGFIHDFLILSFEIEKKSRMNPLPQIRGNMYESISSKRVRIMLKGIMGLAAFLLLSAPLFAQTADDCIAEYEDMKLQFEAAAPDAQLNCVNEHKIISLDTEGNLPVGCSGSWDHWHLEAKSNSDKEGFCSVMLRGLEGQEGCGTEEIRFNLPANEAAAWRNYLRKECRD